MPESTPTNDLTERIKKRLAEVTEKRLTLLVYRDNLARHLTKITAEKEIVDRDIVAYDALQVELQGFVGEK